MAGSNFSGEEYSGVTEKLSEHNLHKMSKNMLATAINLYLLFADNKPAAEVHSAATDRQQALIVYARNKAFYAPSLPLSLNASPNIADWSMSSIIFPCSRIIFLCATSPTSGS